MKLLRLMGDKETSDQDFCDGAVHVLPSQVNGLGVFAGQKFATGESILTRNGRPVSIDHPLDPSEGESEQHCATMEGGHRIYLRFPERFVNHSCDANAFIAERGGRIELIALRPINPREEVFVNYGVDRHRGVPFKCHCGSASCLVVIPADFFSLPLNSQMELSPFLSPWFIHEHEAEYRAFEEQTGFSPP